MRIVYRTIAVMLLAMMMRSAIANPFGLEARSLGMGNVSVVTSDIATAPFANPAMLAYQKPREDFAFLIPAVGAYLDDRDGMVDLIDEYQAADTAQRVAIASQFGTRVISPQISAATALGFSGNTYSFAVSARTDIVAKGIVDALDPTNPNLILLGVQTTELGVSAARNFNVMGRKMSVGFTPKAINVRSISVSESLATVDTGATDILDNATETDHGGLTTLDVGMVIELSKHIQAGLVVKNLITDEANINIPSVGTAKLSFDTQSRAGIAYRGNFFTVGADLDLMENDPSITSNVAALAPLQGEKTRMLSLGAEFNAFDIAQLRVGMQQNLASGISAKSKDELLTAGVGFWFGFHLDVSVISGDDIIGLFAQTGFRF